MEDHDLKQLADRVTAGLIALQEAQRLYDAEMWDIATPQFSNLRHIHLHLSITVGKLARLLEPQDHRAYHGREVESLDPDELRAIVSDLMIHAAQIANTCELDLGRMLTERYRGNAVRFAPNGTLKTFGVDV